ARRDRAGRSSGGRSIGARACRSYQRESAALHSGRRKTMAPAGSILAFDQGSTSSRAVVYDRRGRIAFLTQEPLGTVVAAPDRVEHDPSELGTGQLRALSRARQWLGAAGACRIAALAVTNQRSTFLLWDRWSGKPVGRAISWQDRRGAEAVAEMASHRKEIQA